MKEKIAEIIRKPLMVYHPQVGMTMVVIDKGIAEDMITQILSLQREDIKKSLLTGEEVWAAYGADATDGDIRGIAEAQLDKVQKALES